MRLYKKDFFKVEYIKVFANSFSGGNMSQGDSEYEYDGVCLSLRKVHEDFQQSIQDCIARFHEEQPGVAMQSVPKTDINVLDMARYLSQLPFPSPKEKDFFSQMGFEPFGCQKMLVGWLASQITLGGSNYSRQTPNFSFRTMWTHLISPEALLWLAYKFEIDESIIKDAGMELQTDKKTQSKCAAIRKIISVKDVILKAKEKLGQ